MAFAALGALFAAETVTSAIVLSAMAEVGTAMTVVGAVTGNKDLMKIGGVVGLVGGVGGMISGASGAAAGADAMATSQSNFRVGEIAAQNTSEVAGATASGGVGSVVSEGAPNISAPTDTQALQQGSAVDKFASAPTTGTPSVNTVAPAPTDVATVNAPGAPTTPGDVGAKFATGTDSAKGNSFFNYLKDPANKEIVNTGVKLVGETLSGIQKAESDNQKMQLETDKFDYQKSQDANVRQQNKSRSGIIQLAKV